MILDITTYGTFNIDYWKAERFIVKYETNKEVAFYWNDGSVHLIARYQPADGVVLIDITDFVRTYPERNTLGFQAYGGIPRIVNVTIAGLINPAGVHIPAHDGEDIILVTPPSCMYYSSTFPPAIFETRPRAGVTGLKIKQRNAAGVPIGFDTLPVPSATLNSTTDSFDIENGEGVQILSRTLRDTNCACRYACVEWVSFTGVRRRHTFEYIKSTIAADGGFSLLNLNNEYNTIKGREDGLTLRLTGLDMYDLWYYADLVTSSEVKVSLNGTTWTQVEVTTKNVTIPDGEATDGKLEVTIKYKRYDAVSL